MTYSFVADGPAPSSTRAGPTPRTRSGWGSSARSSCGPPAGAGYAYDRADSQFTPAEEFMVLLSEIDPYQHQAADRAGAFNITTTTRATGW